MKKWIIRCVRLLLAATLLLLFGLWFVLQSPFLNQWRSGVLEEILTEQIGQPLRIFDEVKVSPGRTVRILVSGVEIPSENIADFELASLERMELDLDAIALLRGNFKIDDIVASGLKIHLLTKENGIVSWSASRVPISRPAQAKTVTGTETGIPIIDFLKKQKASFEAMRLLVENEETGFEFDFILEKLSFAQLIEGAQLNVLGVGSVNGQSFKVTGEFPKAAPFSTLATFGEMEIRFDGERMTLDEGGGYYGDLEFRTGNLGDFLEVLRLGRPFEGEGMVSARVIHQRRMVGLADILLIVDQADGRQYKAEGAVGNIYGYKDIDLRVEARLHPENRRPPEAEKLTDFRLASVSSHITSEDGKLEFEELLVRTNLINRGFDEIGPFQIGHIRRTEDNKLAMTDITLQTGPPDAPIMVVRGDLMDVLSLKSYDVEGELVLPASLVLGHLGKDVAAAFGSVRAGFAVDDSKGKFRIRRFDALTEDTSIWAMRASGVFGNVNSVDGLSLDFDLTIDDGARFLAALNLNPIDTKRFELLASVRGAERRLSAELDLTTGSSQLKTNISASKTGDHNSIEGRIFSEELKLTDLQKSVSGLIEIAKLAKDPPKREVKPLVLPRNVQPLVLPKTEIELKELVDVEEILLRTSVDMNIDIKKISGVQGVTSISSKLTLTDGKGLFGPIEFAYGGGYLRTRAAVDLISAPDKISVSGSTGGWDFGKILDSLGVGIGANGILNGSFNLTGKHTSVRSFVNTMTGSVSASMRDGRIATSLIELAGLGIFPWLFSEELRQKSTTINCLAAPLRINNGKATFDAVVAETNRVQLVGKGTVDWKNDSINLRAEPRRIGRPLSRSAWPFEVTGALSDPKFKLIVGGSGSKRADGADQMSKNRQACIPDIFQLH